jgi:hypothetical protein
MEVILNFECWMRKERSEVREVMLDFEFWILNVEREDGCRRSAREEARSLCLTSDLPALRSGHASQAPHVAVPLQRVPHSDL